ncbi:MAG: hypothetical protein IJ778_03775 [Alphaproteobacteria bacterium]|nr:hypothetical protein [Alphaproteobacteria bacterium]
METKSVLNILKEQIGCNQPATAAQIAMCNVKLKQARLPEIPADYAELLTQANGFSNEGALAFGAEIKNNNWFTDIVKYNQEYFDGKPSSWLILGADDWFYFVYNKIENKYGLLDQDTLKADWISENIEVPLFQLLKIEY